MEQQHLESRNKLYSKLKRGAFMGGAVGVCIGLAVGTTSLFGYVIIASRFTPSITHFVSVAVAPQVAAAAAAGHTPLQYPSTWRALYCR